MSRPLGFPRRTCAAIACAALGGAGVSPALAQTSAPISALSLRNVQVTSVANSPVTAYSLSAPPLSGFQPRVVVGLTNERLTQDDVVGYAQIGNSPGGSTLPIGGPAQYVVATLDSGSQAHIFNPTTSAGFDLAGAGLEGTKSQEVQGAGGSSSFLPISDGLGVYMTGLQNATGGSTIGVSGPMRGDWNNPILTMEDADPRFPNIIGGPILAHWQAVIKNSQTRHITVGTETFRSPSVTIQPVNTPLPAGEGYSRIQLFPSEAGPPEDPYFLNFDFTGSDNPDNPATWPSLLTKATVSHTDGTAENQDFLFDTGAQVSLISEFTASQIGYYTEGPNPSMPDFEVEVLAVDGVIMVPGFFMESMTLTTTGGPITWNHVPVLVHNVADPRSPSSALPGLIGMNLFNDRDLILNAGVNGPPGSTYVAFSPQITPRWTYDGGGTWNEDEKWSLGSPDGPDLQANFTNAITADAAITVDSVGFTVGAIKFDNAHRYTLNGPGTLRVEAFSIGNAVINVVSGSHTIAAPMTLASDTTITVGPAASTLMLSGDVDATAADVTKTGAGTVEMKNVRAASLHVDGGAVAVQANGTAAGMVQVTELTVAPGAVLRMNNNDFIVDYDPADPSPEFALRDLVKATAQGGASGVSFTAGAGDVAIAVAEKTEWGFSTFNGVTLDDTTIVGKYTYYGDANLDGAVTSDDYVAVDVGLGSGDSWVQGDFNFSGTVTSDDYVAIDVNLGKGSPTPLAFAEIKAEMIALHTEMFGAEYLEKLAYAEANGFGATLVPEPTVPAALLALVGSLAARRRHRRAAPSAL